jgi:2-polyprenyl-3-methyl-5-hydroxy-6-metoxy-1,4-benzoquinol methylase
MVGAGTSSSGGSSRAHTRTAVVWRGLVEHLADLPAQAEVLDIGGGTGGFAVRVAEQGHRVTVVDPSPDALAILGRRSSETQVSDRVRGVQGDLSTLADLVAAGELAADFDLVLCHGVLEVVDDPGAAMRVLAERVRPGGVLSLLVAQRHAAVVARATAGHLSQALATLRGSDTTRRFTVEEISSLLDGAGFGSTTMHAVRVFTDLVPSSVVDIEPGAGGLLAELEEEVAERPEYLALGTQVHALARRP